MMPYRFTRRDALCIGALGGIGLSLPQLLRAEASPQRKQGNSSLARRAASPRQKSIILIVPWGGPAQMDTLDLKPEAPSENRSPYRQIDTNVPGIRICEHFQHLSRMADQYAVIRAASHRISTHNPATHYTLTGHPPPITNQELVPANRNDWPSLGSVLAKFRPASELPSYVQLPLPLIDNNSFSGGQHAGFLGTAFDPVVINSDPNKADFTVPGLARAADMTGERINDRGDLLRQLDSHAQNWHAAAAIQNMAIHYERAYDLLRSAVSRQAFDIAQEPERVRERYGRTRFGQSTLMARRLVEAGVRLVLVGDTTENTNGKWDTHGGDVQPGITRSIVETDLGLSALLTDLRDRGLLETTIVAWIAEFGRTPRMNGRGGRDHWPQVYSLLLAGGGIRGGQVHGSSDSLAAYPHDNACSPAEIHATIYTLMGVPLDTMFSDALGRPYHLCDARPIRALI